MKKDKKIRRLTFCGSSAIMLAITIYLLTFYTGCGQSSAKNVEERLKQLEATNEIYQKKLNRLDAVQEIQNMMGRYVFMHEVQRDPELIEMFAKNQPDVSWEVAHLGLYVGYEAIKEILNQHGAKGGTPSPGTLFLHTLSTPVIEVAEDGQTAKGVWHSPGAETINDPKTGKVRGFWSWTKYACDFIREDGNWKILHYHVYRTFLTPADMNYTEDYESKVLDKSMGGASTGAAHASSAGGIPQASTNKQPTTYDNPFKTTYVPGLVPAPPQPYKTFSETFSYGKPEEK